MYGVRYARSLHLTRNLKKCPYMLRHGEFVYRKLSTFLNIFLTLSLDKYDLIKIAKPTDFAIFSVYSFKSNRLGFRFDRLFKSQHPA